jgi:hypothetical protein
MLTALSHAMEVAGQAGDAICITSQLLQTKKTTARSHYKCTVCDGGSSFVIRCLGQYLVVGYVNMTTSMASCVLKTGRDLDSDED